MCTINLILVIIIIILIVPLISSVSTGDGHICKLDDSFLFNIFAGLIVLVDFMWSFSTLFLFMKRLKEV